MSTTNGVNHDIDADDLFDVLSERRRRRIIEEVLQRDDRAAVDDVVETVVEREMNGHDDREDLRSQVTVSLHHVHLPKLNEAGLIDYDPSVETIGMTDTTPVAEPHLASIGELD